MAKKATIYAQVLLETLDGVPQKEQRVRVERFKNLLKKRGDLRFSNTILQEFEKLWEQRKGTVARLVSASKLPPSISGPMKKSLKGKGYQIREEVNELLIGGSVVFLGNEYLFDNTVKGKLQKLKEVLKS